MTCFFVATPLYNMCDQFLNELVTEFLNDEMFSGCNFAYLLLLTGKKLSSVTLKKKQWKNPYRYFLLEDISAKTLEAVSSRIFNCGWVFTN